jgi:hypothetical protein
VGSRPGGDDAFEHLAPGSGAGDHGLVDLGLHDPGQFAQLLECRVELGAIIRIGIARHEVADAGHHGAQLGKVADGFMRALRQIDDVLAVEQPFYESIDSSKPYPTSG